MPAPDESGVNVYPRLQVPKGGGRESDPSLKRPRSKQKTLLIVAVMVGVGGLLAGFLIRPLVAPSGRIGELEDEVAVANKATKTAKSEADDLAKAKTDADARADKVQHDLDDALGVKSKLESRSAELDKKSKEIADVEAKLKVVIDKNGSVTNDGEEIHLQLVDKILFKLNDDQLTDKGKEVIGSLAGALKDIPDKLIWVQGHTDDQPIFVPPPPKAPPPPKKGAKPAPAPVVAPLVRFTSNWELSAARALSVVHYLQDVGKIDPRRLAALAFGQYHPSGPSRAQNRRIEIVLVPKKSVVEKITPPAPAAPTKK